MQEGKIRADTDLMDVKFVLGIQSKCFFKHVLLPYTALVLKVILPFQIALSDASVKALRGNEVFLRGNTVIWQRGGVVFM